MSKHTDKQGRLRWAAFFSILLLIAAAFGEAEYFLAASAVVTIPDDDTGNTPAAVSQGNEPAVQPATEAPAITNDKNYRSTMVKKGGEVYYFLKNGKLAISRWVKYKKKWYYFDQDGKMVKNAWIDNYYVDLKGRRCKTITKKKILKKTTKKERKLGKKLIIAGASRVMHMGMHVSYDQHTIYVCRRGAGIKFLTNNAGPRICAYLAMFPNSTVVFQFGNNSLASYRSTSVKYFKYYRKLMAAFPDADFYFMDALPGKTKKRNKLRIKFNRLLQAAFPEQYIGGFEYLMSSGIQFSSDGEHYRPATSCMIYDYILKKTHWVP